MKYRDLVSFEPIEQVKELRHADDLAQARQDVETLVVSPRLAEQLTELILPNMDLDSAPDAKGLLIVANYGTGKTHLMSVVSSILEHAELVEAVRSEAVREAAAPLGGRYRVIRAEIGATKMGLRDIITRELTDGLARLGVDFEFPDLTQVTNTKRSLEEMMAAFEAVHGDSGLLFVLDEMLEYLAGRRDHELRLDLTVLREIGEICKSTRFRFIGSVQEAVFDNPRFASAADAIVRVRERFAQVRISREDIAHVVTERLLTKTAEQKAMIRAHLGVFAPAYEGMAERLESFVALFPVHPAYLRIFEQVTLVEKRRVLTTLSEEMGALLDSDVPEDAPGLICFDTYRAQLAGDPSNRTIPEVREVLEVAQVLRARVERALPTPEFRSTALRIVDGLAVHRLTTEEIDVPIGPSPAELRDDLTLLPPGLPERDSFFLETTVGTIVEEIIRTVSGQFISVNEDNGQVYLDVRKDIDYDRRIDERAESLDHGRLDEAYFRALETVLEQRDTPYVAGYRIWSYELDWALKQATRRGYLFMGAPNERSTAQPPRDFYVYFLQPYDPPRFDDDERSDEVFFRLSAPDDEFTGALARYAGATALEAESTGQHRTVYAAKRERHLREMVSWLRAHMGDAVTVTYRGDTGPVASAAGSVPGPGASVKERIDGLAAAALAAHFEDRYPGYPAFGVQVTGDSLARTVRGALQQIAANRPNDLGTRVLRALGLLDVKGNLVAAGPYAEHLLMQVEHAAGRAVNRAELFVERDRGVFTWGPWHLEPCWFTVVAAALTQLGRLEIGFAGGQLDAVGLDRLPAMSLEDLESVTHVAPPQALPLTALKEAIGLIDVPPGHVGPLGATADLVQSVATKCAEYADKLAHARTSLGNGITVWGAEVLEFVDERSRALRAFEDLVNDLRARNTAGKLNRIDRTREQIGAARRGRDAFDWLESAATVAAYLADVTAYLREAVEVFGAEDPASVDAAALRAEVLALFDSEAPPDRARAAAVRTAGETLRRRFAELAVAAHGRDRLDGAGDERKRRLRESDTYRSLGLLATLELLPGGLHRALEQKLIDLGTCKSFDPAAMSRTITCPGCGYRPRSAGGATAAARLERIEEEVADLYRNWERTLAENLAVREMAEQVALLRSAEQEAVHAFVASGRLPEPLGQPFVEAVRQVLHRFEVYPVSPREVWDALFPRAAPATPAEVRQRLGELIDGRVGDTAEERVRLVPREGDAS